MRAEFFPFITLDYLITLYNADFLYSKFFFGIFLFGIFYAQHAREPLFWYATHCEAFHFSTINSNQLTIKNDEIKNSCLSAELDPQIFNN